VKATERAQGEPAVERKTVQPAIVTLIFATLIILGTIAPSPGDAQPAMTDRDASGEGQQVSAYFSPFPANAVGAPVPGTGQRNDRPRREVAWLDLTGGPLVVSAPVTGRHYVVPMRDRWTGVAASPGAHITGTLAVEFLVVLPSWQGPLPAGMARIDSPTPHVWIIGPTETDAFSDHGALRRTPAGYRIAPLSEWARDPARTIDVASVLNKGTLTIDRPKLSPEDIKELEAAQRAAARGRE